MPPNRWSPRLARWRPPRPGPRRRARPGRGASRRGPPAAPPPPGPGRSARPPTRPRHVPRRRRARPTPARQLTVAVGRSWVAKRTCAIAAPAGTGRHLDRDEQLPGLERRLPGAAQEVAHADRAACLGEPQLEPRLRDEQPGGGIGMRVREAQVAAERADGPDPDVGDVALDGRELGPACPRPSATGRPGGGSRSRRPAASRRRGRRRPRGSGMRLTSTRSPKPASPSFMSSSTSVPPA